MSSVLLRAIVASAVAWLAAGCAVVEDKVPIDYVSQVSAPAPLPGAENVLITVSARDRRAQLGDRVSTKKNGYGMEMARIVSTNDVVDLVRTSVEREFKAQGFRVGPGGVAVSIELQNFYNNFQLGIVTGAALADVSFGLKVRDATGAQLYAHDYSGSAKLDNIMLMSGDNAKVALQQALAAAVKQVVDDAALQQVLLSTRARNSRGS
jgi:uncharacterized lipoprotein YajG